MKNSTHCCQNFFDERVVKFVTFIPYQETVTVKCVMNKQIVANINLPSSVFLFLDSGSMLPWYMGSTLYHQTVHLLLSHNFG